MKLLVLAVFLAVIQTSTPVPRQTSDNTARSRQDIKQQPGTKQSPAANSLPVPNTPSPKDEKDKGETPAKADTQETIFITESAAVPVRDGWDKAYVVFTGLLVIVGGVGVFFAIKTLRGIERQAKANEDTLAEIKTAGAQTDKMIEHAEAQASTAKDSLDLSRDTAKKQLRAYLSVSEAMIKFNSEWIVEPQLHVTNAGQTPAYDVRQWLKTRIEELPPRWIPQEQPEELPEGGTVIGATNKDIMVAQAFEVPEDRRPSFGTKYAVLWVYGRISYRDVFGDKHYTDFRLFYGGPGIRNSHKNGENWGLLQRHSEGNGAT